MSVPVGEFPCWLCHFPYDLLYGRKGLSLKIQQNKKKLRLGIFITRYIYCQLIFESPPPCRCIAQRWIPFSYLDLVDCCLVETITVWRHYGFIPAGWAYSSSEFRDMINKNILFVLFLIDEACDALSQSVRCQDILICIRIFFAFGFSCSENHRRRFNWRCHVHSVSDYACLVVFHMCPSLYYINSFQEE